MPDHPSILIDGDAAADVLARVKMTNRSKLIASACAVVSLGGMAQAQVDCPGCNLLQSYAAVFIVTTFSSNEVHYPLL